MDLAAQAAASGAAEGLVIVAGTQTAGRGRRGRPWVSPPGAGLYLSLLLRPTAAAIRVLTLGAGVGVRDGIRRATGLETTLKWPNDVLAGGRKISGVLAEGHALGTARQAVVLGIGLNLRPAACPPDLAGVATSLEAELGRPVDDEAVLTAVLAAVGEVYEDLSGGRADDILRRWREAAPGAVGSVVEWDGPDGLRTGLTDGIDDDGALRVRTADGAVTLSAGEVRLRR